MPQSGNGSVTYFILELKIVQATGQQLSHLSPSRSPLWSLFISREGAPAQEEAGGRKRYVKPYVNQTLAMKLHQVWLVKQHPSSSHRRARNVKYPWIFSSSSDYLPAREGQLSPPGSSRLNDSSVEAGYWFTFEPYWTVQPAQRLELEPEVRFRQSLANLRQVTHQSTRLLVHFQTLLDRSASTEAGIGTRGKISPRVGPTFVSDSISRDRLLVYSNPHIPFDQFRLS
jgi:hypothetical protein